MQTHPEHTIIAASVLSTYVYIYTGVAAERAGLLINIILYHPWHRCICPRRDDLGWAAWGLLGLAAGAATVVLGVWDSVTI